MTQNNKAKIYDALVKLSILFDERPSQDRISAFSEVLSRYPLPKVAQAINLAQIECDRFPSLAHLVRLMQMRKDQVDDGANMTAGDIISAISRCGKWQASEAQKIIGPEGWEVVERYGGWTSICEVTNEQLGILRAQLRDLAKGILRKNQNFIQIAYDSKKEIGNE